MDFVGLPNRKGPGGTTGPFFGSATNGRSRVAMHLFAALMRLLRRYLRQETPELVARGIRLEVVGRRDRLETELVEAIEEAEVATAGGAGLTLRLAVDYSSRELVARAVARLARRGREEAGGADPGSSDGWEGPDRDALARALGEVMHSREPAGEVDLLIRTGGEQRLSDFRAPATQLDATSTMRPFAHRDEFFLQYDVDPHGMKAALNGDTKLLIQSAKQTRSAVDQRDVGTDVAAHVGPFTANPVCADDDDAVRNPGGAENGVRVEDHSAIEVEPHWSPRRGSRRDHEGTRMDLDATLEVETR